MRARALPGLAGRLSRTQHELDTVTRELLRSTAELERARDRWFELFEASPVGYVRIDSKLEVVAANLTVASMTGKSRGMLVGRPFSELVADEDERRLAVFCDAALANTGRSSLLVSLRGPGGQRGALVEALRVGHAPPGELLVAVFELQRLRAAERSLGERDIQSATILDATGDGIITLAIGSGGVIESVNAAAGQMFAYAPRELVGRPIELLLPGQSVLIGRARELVGRRRDGHNFAVEVTAGALEGGLGRTVVVSIRDISERKQQEERLRQTQRLEAVGTLASGIAHDFNNLLMGIAGIVQRSMRDLEPGDPTRERLRLVLGATMRGSHLARRLVQFGEARAAEPISFEIDAAVRDARELLARLLGGHIALVVETSAPGRHVQGEPGDVEQMLMNLASNARDAMPDGGTLTIRTAARGDDAVVVTVRDTGVGMDEATRARIFEPFFTTKDVGKGTGLGLSTVFSVVRRLGGDVEVQSAPAKGTTFSLVLPCWSAPVDAARARSRETPRGRERVLVVEDDSNVRVAVIAYLEDLGYATIAACGTDEAMEIWSRSRHDVDLVLTDVMMPGKLGAQLARELREADAEVPILFMSAHPSAELVRTGRVEGHETVLEKPFDQAALGWAVRRTLDARPPRDRVRILVVDDNADVADTFAELLEGPRREIAIASSGQAAIEAAVSQPPDLVLCDLDLGSGPSGLDVVRALRGNERTRRARLVALTGHAGAEERSRALAAGFDLVLVKPPDLEEIERIIRGATRAGEREAKAAAPAGR